MKNRKQNSLLEFALALVYLANDELRNLKCLIKKIESILIPSFICLFLSIRKIKKRNLMKYIVNDYLTKAQNYIS